MSRSRTFLRWPPISLCCALSLSLLNAGAALAAPAPVQLRTLGKCLSLDNEGANGAHAVLETCNGSALQSWQVPPRGFSGPIKTLDGKCLDVTGNMPVDRTPIIVFSCHGLANQSWRHEVDGRVVGLGDKCLDVLESNPENGTPFVLFTCNATPNQLFTAKQRNHWHSEPLLSEAWLFGLAASPAKNERLFAAASTNGILRSENSGADWASANQGVDLSRGVQEIVVDAQNPDLVFALNGGRLLRSKNGGAFFHSFAIAPTEVRTISLDPRRPGRLLALDGDRFYESLDNGDYFEPKTFPNQQSNGTLQQLLVDPFVAGRLWIAAAATCPFCSGPDQGVFRSNDDGATWSRVFSQPTLRIVADPHAAGQIYALADRQLHRTTNGGQSWQLLATFGGPLYDVWVDSAFPGNIVVSHQQGLSRSVDGGLSFVPVPLDLRPGPTGFPAEYVRRFLYSGNQLLAALDAFDGHPGRGVIQSEDLGASWSLQSQHLFAAGHIVDIAFVPGQPEHVWAAGRDGVYQSTDGGVHYSRKLATTGPAEATALLVDPYDASGNTLYVAATRFPGPAGPFLFKSTNGGGTWQGVAAVDGQQIETGGFLATEVAGKQVYLTTLRGSLGGKSYQGILSSDNHGASWKPLDLGVRLSRLAKGRSDLELFAGGDALMRSLDGGKTWQQVQALKVEALTASGANLYFAGDGKLYASQDGGTNLSSLELPPAIKTATSLKVVGNLLYLGDQNGGIYASVDAGHTWTALDLGLPQTRINVLAADPQEPTHLLAGTSGAGLQQALIQAEKAPLRFAQDRFTAKITWRDFLGATGEGRPAVWTEDTGFFWFFTPDNVEVMVKLLDARTINGNYWVFVGSLSNVEFDLTLRDEWTGREKTYHNGLNNFASFGDLDTFPAGSGPLGGDAAEPAEPRITAITAGSTATSDQPAAATNTLPAAATNTAVQVRGGRFEIRVLWEDGSGQNGEGFGRAMTGDTAAFNFFSPTNTELVIKVLDGRPINGHYWVFYGALSNVGYTIFVKDLATGEQVIYQNPVGNFASVGDTEAF